MSWYKALLGWIKRLFKKPEPQITPYIIKEWSSPLGELYLLRRETKGSVKYATFRFIPANRLQIQATSLLLTCDRLRPRRDSTGKSDGGSILGIRDGTPAPGHPAPTHRLSFSQVSQRTNSMGMVETKLLWSYPVDFAGTQTYVRKAHLSLLGWTPEAIEDLELEDRAAIRITAQIAELLLQQDWRKIDFEKQIDFFAEKEVGSNHEILWKSKS